MLWICRICSGFVLPFNKFFSITSYAYLYLRKNRIQKVINSVLFCKTAQKIELKNLLNDFFREKSWNHTLYRKWLARDWQSLIAAFAMVTIHFLEDSKPISKCLSLVPLNGITMSLIHDILIQRSSQVRFSRLFVFSVKTLSIKTNAVSFNRNNFELSLELKIQSSFFLHFIKKQTISFNFIWILKKRSWNSDGKTSFSWNWELIF